MVACVRFVMMMMMTSRMRRRKSRVKDWEERGGEWSEGRKMKIIRLLWDSLGGNARTLLVACVRSMDEDENEDEDAP